MITNWLYDHLKQDRDNNNKPKQTMPGENDRWKFYKDHLNEWRWTRKALNGETVGASTEGYKNRGDCYANAMRNGYIEGGDCEDDNQQSMDFGD